MERSLGHARADSAATDRSSPRCPGIHGRPGGSSGTPVADATSPRSRPTRSSRPFFFRPPTPGTSSEPAIASTRTFARDGAAHACRGQPARPRRGLGRLPGDRVLRGVVRYGSTIASRHGVASPSAPGSARGASRSGSTPAFGSCSVGTHGLTHRST